MANKNIGCYYNKMDSTSKNFIITPLRPNQKLPMLKGFTKAENLMDYHKIALKSGGNYGVLMGQPSGVIVLDIDLKKVDKNDTDILSIWEVDSVKRQFGDTYIIRTPSGGLHIFLKWDERMTLWTTKLELNNKFQTDKDFGYIDIKVSGMCVGEGSQTEQGTYKCINGSPDKVCALDDNWYGVLDELQSPVKTENLDTDFYDFLPELEELGFTGIKQVSDYSFDCDQKGRGSKCPLCQNEHRSNHFQIFNDGFKVSVKNFSNKCIMTKLKSAPAFLGDTTPPPAKEEEEEEATDKTEAVKFLEDMDEKGHKFIRFKETFIWYNPEIGIWGDMDKYTLRKFITDCDVIAKPYANSAKKQDNLITILKSKIENDDKFMLNAFNTTYRKLAFANGVWDFEKQELISFSPEYRFFNKIDFDFVETFNQELANEIMEKIIYGTLDKERGDYYMKLLARAISGDVYDKVMAVMIGRGNSGKGLNAELLEKSFQNFVGTFNSGNLSKKLNVGDEAKSRSWMAALANKRIAICSEASVSTPYDAGVIQSFVSGGDTLTARTNFKDEQSFKLSCTPFAFVNDQPEIKGAGDPIRNRMRYLQTQYAYLPKEQIKEGMIDTRVADDSIKSVFVQRPDVIQTFAMMVCKSFCKDAPTIPKCVADDGDDWCEADSVEIRISELYEVDETDKSYITAKQLYTICKQSGIEISQTKLGMIMKSQGHPSKQIEMQRKKVVVYKNIKLKRDTTPDY